MPIRRAERVSYPNYLQNVRTITGNFDATYNHAHRASNLPSGQYTRTKIHYLRTSALHRRYHRAHRAAEASASGIGSRSIIALLRSALVESGHAVPRHPSLLSGHVPEHHHESCDDEDRHAKGWPFWAPRLCCGILTLWIPMLTLLFLLQFWEFLNSQCTNSYACGKVRLF